MNHEQRPVTELKGVTLLRNGAVLLDNIDWTIQQGEHWAILGPNGSGKTLLMRILAGYLWPSRGAVTLLGEALGTTEVQRLREKIGWVSAGLELELPEDQTVLEIVLTGARATLRLFTPGKTANSIKAKRLARDLGLGEQLHQPYETLSTGEKKKTLIARALMRTPRLLILDEVCAGLDPVARKDLLYTVNTVCRTQKDLMLLYVTHHVEELPRCINNILLIKKGTIYTKGSAKKSLTTENMAGVFGKNVKLKRTQNGFELKVNDGNP